eukprot:TRINITY_DN13637_c0_g1_i1.p1 TRINITY_DN13637_c0_g1~~TRINITY_DN13637_c0_g1_i1.p1  ORF type:complete len:595 (+),score=168.28 TRINITY_DN13637_c0_g1_i1:62-1846(+)
MSAEPNNDMEGSLRLHPVDYTSAVIVFVAVAAITVRSWRVQEYNMYYYFLGGRNAPWWVVGCSLFSYGTGVEYVMGMATAGYTDGIAASIFMWGSIPPLLGLAYFFLKEYRELDIITLPTFLFKPFDGTTRLIYAVFTLVLSIMRIAISLHAFSVLMDGLLGISRTVTKVVLIILIELYVVTGGLRAVMETEVIQSVLLIVFSLVLSVRIINEVGGIENLKKELNRNQTKLFLPASDDTYPWPGVVFGFPIEAMVHWSCSQVITQKALAAEDDYHAKMGCMFCGLLNLIPPFLFVIPGMALNIDRPRYRPEDAYQVMVMEKMPEGTRGFLLAALTLSLATSVASVLSACTAIITVDILDHCNFFREARSSALQRNKVLAARVGTFAVAVAGFAFSYAIPSVASKQWDNIMFSSIFSAATFAAFVSAYYYGTAWSVKPVTVTVMLGVGLALGFARMILDELKETNHDIPDSVSWYADVNFHLLTAALFVLNMAGMRLASMAMDRYEWSGNTVILEPQDSLTEVGSIRDDQQEPTEVSSIMVTKKDCDDEYEDDFEGTVVPSEVLSAQFERYRTLATNVVVVVSVIAFVVIISVWF